MNRELWSEWAAKRAQELRHEPWLLSKWETVAGVVWPEEKIALMISDLAAKLELTPSSWLLDLGCGPGWIGQRLQAHAAAVVGVDYSPAMLGAAAQLTDLLLIQADAAALPLASASFDRILVYFTLMNLAPEKILAVLREGLRVLTPGGRLLAGQMPLAGKRARYDEEKQRYLAACRARFQLGADLARDHAPPIVLFADDYDRRLASELGVTVTVTNSFNHFWREGEPAHCDWRVDYLLAKGRP